MDRCDREDTFISETVYIQRVMGTQICGVSFPKFRRPVTFASTIPRLVPFPQMKIKRVNALRETVRSFVWRGKHPWKAILVSPANDSGERRSLFRRGRGARPLSLPKVISAGNLSLCRESRRHFRTNETKKASPGPRAKDNWRAVLSRPLLPFLSFPFFFFSLSRSPDFFFLLPPPQRNPPAPAVISSRKEKRTARKLTIVKCTYGSADLFPPGAFEGEKPWIFIVPFRCRGK